MRYLVIPLLALAVIFGLALAGPLQERWQDSNAYARQADALAIARQQTQLQDYQTQTAATAASRALASNAGYLGFVLVGLLGVAYAVDRAARRREPLVKFGGELVPRRLVEDGRLIEILARRLEMQDVALIEDKRRALVPASLNYSPRIEQIADAPPAPALLTVDAPIEVIKPQAEWLHWIDEQPHTLLAGKTKAGKTWLASALLERRLRNRESVFIIDPHASGWLGLPTAGSAANDGELGRALGSILAEYIGRMQKRDQHKKETGAELPHDYFGRLTVLVDEANAISDELKTQWTTVCKQLASGSRKVGISLLLMAQSPLVEDLNISGAMRENFARVALDDRSVQLLIDGERDKPRQAALRAALIGMDRPAAAQIGAQVWLLDRRGLDAGTAPAGARAQVWRGWDFDRGCRAPANGAAIPETLKETVSASETVETSFEISPEIAQIVKRLRNEGKSKVQVIFLVWGAKPGGSKGFKEASTIYDQIVDQVAA